MDPHFDPQRSSTNTIKTCGGDKKCYFKQSYTEGSSWSAFKVRDKVWVGGMYITCGFCIVFEIRSEFSMFIAAGGSYVAFICKPTFFDVIQTRLSFVSLQQAPV